MSDATCTATKRGSGRFGLGGRRCGKPATATDNGEPRCTIHSAAYASQRLDKRRARWERQDEIERRRRACEAAGRSLCEIAPEIVAALPAGSPIAAKVAAILGSVK